MPKLNIESKIVSFGDPTVNSNPKLRYVDWTRSFLGLDVDNPRIQQYTIRQKSGVLVGNAEYVGDNTSITFSAIDTSKNQYLGSFVTGLPNTATGIIVSGTSVQFTPVQDGLQLVFDGSATMVAGNSVYLSPFFGLNNQGQWIVTSVTSLTGSTKQVSLVRDPSSEYSGSEAKTVTTTLSEQITFFVPQLPPGSSVSLSGYSFPDGPYVTILRNRFTSFEFMSSALPAATGTKTLLASTSPIRFLYVESDQPLSVKFDVSTAATDGHMRLQPSSNGDETAVATLLIKDTYLNTVSLYNNGTVPAKVTVITGE